MTPSGMNDAGAPGGTGASGPDLVLAIGGDKDGDQAADKAAAAPDCVPLSALQMPDESEQMQAPEVGDKVQYTVEGTIEKIDGDEAYVKRAAINGQPVDNEEAQGQGQSEKEPDADDEGQGAGYGDLKDIANHTQLQ